MRSPLVAAVVAAVAATAVAILVTILLRRRKTPEERERRRRLDINARGRMIEGLVTEARDNLVFFRYSWRGIDYDTSQDLSFIADLLPGDRSTVIGPVTVKFLSENPYNSIVVCEDWSGFPRQSKRTASDV